MRVESRIESRLESRSELRVELRVVLWDHYFSVSAIKAEDLSRYE